MMRYLLSQKNLQRLGSLKPNDTLFAFDFDGTLSSIVTQSSKAQIRNRTKKLIRKLNEESQIAIISGRSISDLKKRLEFNPKYIIGNHGIEGIGLPLKVRKSIQKTCATWKKQLLIDLSSHRFIELEDKTYSLSIHYRNAPHAVRAKKIILEAIQNLNPKPRVIAGKCVYNLLPHQNLDKGQALIRLLKISKMKRALYIGDDDTDEDVFRLKIPELFTVRVGNCRTSQAQYYIKNQSEINSVLEALKCKSRTLHSCKNSGPTS